MQDGFNTTSMSKVPKHGRGHSKFEGAIDRHWRKSRSTHFLDLKMKVLLSQNARETKGCIGSLLSM